MKIFDSQRVFRRWLVAGVWAVCLATGCDATLEADEYDQSGPDARADAAPVDAEPDATPLDAGCQPVPPLVRFEDVPVGEVAAAAVPIGCGRGLVLRAARLVGVQPADAFYLPAPALGVAVDHLRLTYRPRLVAEQAQALLVLTTERDEFTVPIAGQARWSDAACRTWEVAALATGVDGLHRIEATPPAGVAPTAAWVQWDVLTRPPGSNASISEDFQPDGPGTLPDDPATPGAWLSLDLEGLYTLECTVKPPPGSGCPQQQTRITLQQCPCLDDVRVRLTWATADGVEQPADLNLHLLHPSAAAFGAPGLDCTAADPDPRWFAGAAPLERPTHTGNDATAPGFEGIQLPRVEAEPGGPYRVAVEHADSVPVQATVQIFLSERMVWQRTQALTAEAGWWDVAAIGWHRGALVTAPIHRVVPAGEAPDPWAPLPVGVACLPDQRPPCVAGATCRDDDGALVGQCRR